MSVDDQELDPEDLGPYPCGVIPGDAGEGEWWLEAPPEGPLPAWCYAWRGPLAPVDYSSEWWAGCLEGMRIGLELARLDPTRGIGAPRDLVPGPPAPGRRAIVEPTIPGRRWRS